MFYPYKIFHLNCHQTLQMRLKINFTKGGRCERMTYIMQGNPYLMGEVCPLDDANAKQDLNKVLWKTIYTSTIYALSWKKIVNFVGN